MENCLICKKEITGRSDKKFCSVQCKNYYHTNLRRVTSVEVKEIDIILHRNRSILLEIMGKHKSHLKCLRIELEKRKFNFKYHTHTNSNSAGKVYHFVYDFAWMTFSDDEVLIIRRK
jgi:predicted nucleic acid-binding Zn ribbon protein